MATPDQPSADAQPEPRPRITRRRALQGLAALAVGGGSVALIRSCTGDPGSPHSSGGGTGPTSPVADGTVLPDDPTQEQTLSALFTTSPTLALLRPEDEAALALAATHRVPSLILAPGTPDADALLTRTLSSLKAEHLVLSPGLSAAELSLPDSVTIHPLADVGSAPTTTDPSAAALEWPDAAPEGPIAAEASGTAYAGPATSPAARANATAAGFRVLPLAAPDARVSADSIAAAKQERTLIGLNPEFGTPDAFAERRRLAAALTPEMEQPGGGGLVFPGRTVVALYGHPSGPALGVMGEQDIPAAVDRARALAADYDPHVDVPVIPAFEIIATVAAQEPGPTGSYTNYTDPAELEPWVRAITEAGGYAIIDVQPGRETLLTQVKAYEDLIALPHVGVALDPEWRLEPGQVPLTQVGNVPASEINEVVDWLDDLVARTGSGQKLLMVHQFQLQMIRDREQMSAGTDRVAMLVHCDGHGAPGVKMDTWNVVREGLPPQVFLGWKNFIDEDEPMFTPEQTMAVTPRPNFVSYQ